MNAETRAKEITQAMARGDAVGFRQVEALIAAAIVSAENDKLEEAARLMDRVMADSKAALIRTLKHED